MAPYRSPARRKRGTCRTLHGSHALSGGVMGHVLLRVVRFALCVVLGGVAAGCATSPSRQVSPDAPLYDAMMEHTKPPSVTALEQRAGLRMSRRVTNATHAGQADKRDAGRPYTGSLVVKSVPRTDTPAKAEQRVDIHAARTPVRAFFSSLIGTDPAFNMVIHPDVSGVISLELKHVTIDDVVNIVCDMYRLDCQPLVDPVSGTIRGYKIFPWQLTTHTYPVDFLPVIRKGSSATLVSSGSRERSIVSENDNKESGRVTRYANLGSHIHTEYTSDFWGDLEKTIRSVLQLDLAISSVRERVDALGQREKVIERRRAQHTTETPQDMAGQAKQPHSARITGATDPSHLPADPEAYRRAVETKSITVNRQAGLIVVRAFPEEHREIARLLAQLRRHGQRQVILEAKILEVKLNDGFQFGIDWLAINKGLGSNRFPPLKSEPNSGHTFEGNQGYQRTAGETLTRFAEPFTQGVILSQSDLISPLSLAFREHDFVGFIRLLQRQGQVQVLSSPRIATINNQKAVIKVGSDEFFITGLDSGSVSGSGDAARVSDPTAIFTSMFTGISLDVTPQIGEEEMITLHVHPMVTDVEEKRKSFLINDKPQSLPLAKSETRETDSIIRVRNGEVAVIGGLMKNMSGAHERRLPLLGRIPVLGALFGETDRQWEKSELVILLRPVLVNDRQNWESRVVRSADRVRRMQSKPSLW